MKKFIEFYNANKRIIAIIAVVLAIILIIWALTRDPKVNTSTGGSRSLAECLKDKGAKFYGTSWCPHCTNQKAMFGEDAKNLPYIECSKNGTREVTQVCKDAGITSFPTWKINGETFNGSLTKDQLKQVAGC